MRITKNMVDLMHSMDIRAYMCYSWPELKDVYNTSKNRLISIKSTDTLTDEEYDSVLNFLVFVFNREALRFSKSDSTGLQ